MGLLKNYMSMEIKTPEETDDIEETAAGKRAP
jgi:hypothetical protein